ncbi:hypothetical protein [Pseudoalteromonas sp. McH1-42]|uniref:hypothetical protein n=1 Tax=Pseudoalteromonas sp. McH1-42 TaxID=2917752 RepID=UPI001EF73C9E|nr:hypothetical protein [Pseudoalteromonas sp. McH1-42]MCG7560834.1 hypothetical protein [Pseudoalteromonas sp. McH1-42]
MPTEVIDVIDTAVKIGLGGIITGITTYAVTSKNHKNEKDKYLLEHKYKTLESCAEKMDEFFDAWMGLLTKVGGISRHMENEGKEYTDISKKRWDSIKEKDAALVESWGSKSYAISRFRILGAENIVEAIKKTNTPHNSLREKVIFGKTVLSHDEFKEFRTELNQIKKDVHAAISKFYGSISV